MASMAWDNCPPLFQLHGALEQRVCYAHIPRLHASMVCLRLLTAAFFAVGSCEQCGDEDGSEQEEQQVAAGMTANITVAPSRSK